MAADRAAELTEAYRILSDAGRRAEYDRALRRSGRRAGVARRAEPVTAQHQGTPEPQAPPPPPTAAAARRRRPRRRWARSSSRSAPPATSSCARRRSAASGRRCESVGGDYDETQLRGFDFALRAEAKMFGAQQGPAAARRGSCREVDGAAVADAWAQAGKWGDTSERRSLRVSDGDGAGARRRAGRRDRRAAAQSRAARRSR